MKTLLVIDGHYFLWRAYSVPFKFFSKNGTPLHVLTMYLKLIRKHLEGIQKYTGHECTDIVVVFDSNSPLSKKEIFDGYKSNRKDISEDEENPYKHLPYIFEMLENLGIRYLMEDNIEGDELLGTVVKRFTALDPDNHCFIGSIDTDFYQLISEKVKLISLGKNESYTIKDRDFLSHQLRITPDQYIYHKSLTGDTADNIPGVPNIGPIRASKIINNELVIDLTPFTDIIERNKKLICLNCDYKLDIDWEDLKLNILKLNSSNIEIFELCGF
jgi:DNA polymerase-1